MMANKNKCGVYKEFLTLNSKKKKEEEEEEEPKLKMSKRPEQTPHQIRDTDDRHMKRFSMSYITGKLQVKTRYHCTPIRAAKFKTISKQMLVRM